MAYSPNIKVIHKTTTSFEFQDLNFLDDIPTVLTTMTVQVINTANNIDEVLDLTALGFTTSSQIATISETDLGLASGTDIPDGVYSLTYTWSFTGSSGAESGNTTENWAFVANAEQYVAEKFSDINEYYENNPMGSVYINEIVAAYGMLDGLKIAAINGYSTQYTNILATLDRLILFEDFNN